MTLRLSTLQCTPACFAFVTNSPNNWKIISLTRIQPVMFKTPVMSYGWFWNQYVLRTWNTFRMGMYYGNVFGELFKPHIRTSRTSAVPYGNWNWEHVWGCVPSHCHHYGHLLFCRLHLALILGPLQLQQVMETALCWIWLRLP